MRHTLQSWRPALGVALSVTALVALGCQGGRALGAPEETGARSTQITSETSPTATATTGSALTTEPKHSMASTRTPTPDPSPTPRPTAETTPAPTSELSTAPTVGAMAPDLVLSDLAGNEVRLRGLQGKPVLLNFWASW